MPVYSVQFYRGDYARRQQAANDDGAICYVEHHFNSNGPEACYACVVVARNASARSIAWGNAYTREVARAFGVPDRGVVVGGFGGRGDGNLRRTAMPAILVEPLFVSNPRGAKCARERAPELAAILASSVRSHFSTGGRVAFSVGHRYRPCAPGDRGAPAVGGGWEADLAETVLQLAARLLEGPAAIPAPPTRIP